MTYTIPTPPKGTASEGVPVRRAVARGPRETRPSVNGWCRVSPKVSQDTLILQTARLKRISIAPAAI